MWLCRTFWAVRSVYSCLVGGVSQTGNFLESDCPILLILLSCPCYREMRTQGTMAASEFLSAVHSKLWRYTQTISLVTTTTSWMFSKRKSRRWTSGCALRWDHGAKCIVSFCVFLVKATTYFVTAFAQNSGGLKISVAIINALYQVPGTYLWICIAQELIVFIPTRGWMCIAQQY